ncbi:hypothetical protein BDR26DRAFT_859902 [Obelidium mucronatum]|nr:hypothetical protein BDR26DRAFT_859902 [Obelidium mucronatum]
MSERSSTHSIAVPAGGEAWRWLVEHYGASRAHTRLSVLTLESEMSSVITDHDIADARRMSDVFGADDFHRVDSLNPYLATPGAAPAGGSPTSLNSGANPPLPLAQLQQQQPATLRRPLNSVRYPVPYVPVHMNHQIYQQQQQQQHQQLQQQQQLHSKDVRDGTELYRLDSLRPLNSVRYSLAPQPIANPSTELYRLDSYRAAYNNNIRSSMALPQRVTSPNSGTPPVDASYLPMIPPTAQPIQRVPYTEFTDHSRTQNQPFIRNPYSTGAAAQLARPPSPLEAIPSPPQPQPQSQPPPPPPPQEKHSPLRPFRSMFDLRGRRAPTPPTPKKPMRSASPSPSTQSGSATGSHPGPQSRFHVNKSGEIGRNVASQYRANLNRQRSSNDVTATTAATINSSGDSPPVSLSRFATTTGTSSAASPPVPIHPSSSESTGSGKGDWFKNAFNGLRRKNSYSK